MPPVPIKLGGTGAATLAAAKTALGISSGGGSGPANTDALTEGTSNLYFTTARARASVSAGGALVYSASTGVISYTAPVLSTVATSGSASDLATGTLPGARLPAPTSSALGGVRAVTAPTGQVQTGISTAGDPVFAVPPAGAVPAPTATTLGGVKSATAPTGQVQTGIDTTGAPTFAVAPAGAIPSFTGDVSNGSGTTTLTLASVTTAATIGSNAVIPRITVDAKGRITSIIAQDAGALMDSKDNASASAAATTAINSSVASVRWSARVDITVNNNAGVTEASSGYAVTGGCYFPSSNAIVFATRGLQYIRGSGSVFNAAYS